MAHRRTSSAVVPSRILSLPPFITRNLNLPSTHPRSSIMAALLDVSPRKNRHRITLLSLVSLIALSAYTLLRASPVLTPLRPPALFLSNNNQHALHPPLSQQRRPSSPSLKPSAAAQQRPQLQLSPAQELGAITSFLASLPANSIPPAVDPNNPIDPQLVLDFDTRSPHATDEVDDTVYDVWLRNPVVVFSKLHSPTSREVKFMVESMNLRPAPTIFDVDQRVDAAVLEPILLRLTGASSLPILIVGGTPIHPDDINALRADWTSGQLRANVIAAGAVVNGGKKKKGRK